MKQTTSKSAALAICVFVLASSRLAAAEQDWAFDVSPYLWVASVGVETSLPPSTPGGVDRFDTRLSAGAMLTAQASYRSVGVFMDVAWVRLNTDALSPGPAYSAIDLRSDFIHTTAAVTYRLPLDGKLHAELLAGARVWYVGNDFAVASGALAGFNASQDKTWVDPIVGGSVSYDFAERWSAVVKGTIGGFGVSADIAGEVFAGASYRFNDSCSGILGYRYLHEQYDTGTFSFNLDAQGFLLGVGFHF
ncbi:MAG: hypothetical protein EPO07_06295 [Verrucomicrobia bacterium]|nr:MAG: hypothetical protein EPO07_06295 [Verrucomicrobiota bacterium]